MLRNIQRTLCLLLLLSLASSCGYSSLSRQLKSFRGQKVTIPDGLVEVFGHQVSQVGDKDSELLFVTYFDSTSCNKCHISHLDDYLDLFEIADSVGVLKCFVIFSPREDEYDEVVKDLVLKNFRFPVYVDIDYSFIKANKFVPEDIRFHAFLLDKNRHPVFVGNPTASNELWDLFENTLDNLVRNDGLYIEEKLTGD